MKRKLFEHGQHAAQHHACQPFKGGVAATLLVLAFVAACTGREKVAALPAPVPPVAACVMLDQDGNLDDIRALAVLQPHRRIAVVVGTDGIVSARTAALTAAQFLGARPETAVVSGSARMAGNEALPEWSWLVGTRAAAERLPTLFSSAAAPTIPVTEAVVGGLGDAVARALKDCETVGLIVTGPWSSFVAYYPAIADKLAFVVAQGRSPDDPDDPTWDRVNCSFDRRACQNAVAALHSTPLFWVDLSAAGPPYFITEALTKALIENGPSRLMKQAMQRDDQWRGQQIWDDGAALFAVDPTKFKLIGRHIEPIFEPAALLLHEARLMNGIYRENQIETGVR